MELNWLGGVDPFKPSSFLNKLRYFGSTFVQFLSSEIKAHIFLINNLLLVSLKEKQKYYFLISYQYIGDELRHKMLLLHNACNV